MPTYKITLIPMDSFFFGGMRTFGKDKRKSYHKTERDNKPVSQNYYVISNLLPQQSALLGVLRYQLLAQKGRLDYDKKIGQISEEKDIYPLIGKESFNPKTPPSSYGKIKSLSPLFLSNGTTHLITNSRNFNYSEEDHSAIRVIETYFPNPKQQVFNSQKGTWVTAADSQCTYDYKLGVPELWIDSMGKTAYKMEYDKDYEENEKVSYLGTDVQNGIFYPQTKIGIDKQKPDEAFYKQKRYMLEKGWGFAFYAELDEKLESGLVYMGAERSCFQLKVEDEKQSPKTCFETQFKDAFPHLPKNSLVLTSDAFVSYADIQNNTDFHISTSQDFKALPNNYRFTRQHSDAYSLLGKGSVLYTETPKELIEALTKGKEHFQTIGFNHFISNI